MRPGITVLKVSRSEQGMTLQEYLSMRLGLSNKQTKRLLDSRIVFVNGQRTWMARHPVEERDVIEVHLPREPDHAKLDEMAFLHEDDRFIVVDKPAGILSNGTDSVEESLRQQLGSNAIQAVHRIDRDTTGGLLFARDAEAFGAMVGVFERREVRKVYRAIVQGRFPVRRERIDEPIDHLQAVTLIRVRRANDRASELEAEIETGRTHQIRRHLASAGFPLVGDKQYNTQVLEDPSLRGIPRQMLHAWKLEFAQPFTGAPIAVTAPLPRDYRRCLERLRLETETDQRERRPVAENES